MRIFDSVEHQDEGMLAALVLQDVVKVAEFLSRSECHHALVRAGLSFSVDLLAADEAHGNAGLAAIVDDALDARIGTVLGNGDVVERTLARLQGFTDGMNAENDVTHGHLSLRHASRIRSPYRTYEVKHDDPEKRTGDDIRRVMISIVNRTDTHEQNGDEEPSCEAWFPSRGRKQGDERGHDVTGREGVPMNSGMMLDG